MREQGRQVRELVGRYPLTSFFVLAYGLSWGAWVPFLLSADGWGVWSFRFPGGDDLGMLLGIGPGVFLGPAAAAFTATALAQGRPGLRVWCARLVRWRVAGRWYAFVMLGYPALVFLGIVVLGGASGDLHAPTVAAVLSLGWWFPAQALTSGLGEEPGWRDFAQPRMQERWGPLPGTVLLGVLWGCWHLPLFLTRWAPGGSDPASLAGFVLGAVCFSVVIAWAFNGSGQSLPISILLHAGSNTVGTALVPSMFPTFRVHAGFWSPSLVAALALAVVLVVATRGRLGADRPVPDEPAVPATRPRGRAGRAAWPRPTTRSRAAAAPDVGIRPSCGPARPSRGRADPS